MFKIIALTAAIALASSPAAFAAPGYHLDAKGGCHADKGGKFAPKAMCAAPNIVTAKATPPAGATGKCVDGTYTMSKSKSGACSSHKGLAMWMG